MNEWHDLFMATAGASATLTGLIFVGVSINLTRILSIPKLPGRALLSLVLLLTILIISIVMLMPGQTLFSTGVRVLIMSFICWLFALFIDISIIKTLDKKFRNVNIMNLVFDQIAIIPYFISIISFFKDCDCGIHWIALAFILSFIKSIMDAWGLLIEINR